MNLPPVQTKDRLDFAWAEGAVMLRDRTIVDDAGPLRVEMLDAIVLGPSCSVSGSALASVLDTGCSIAWRNHSKIISFSAAPRSGDGALAERQAAVSSLRTLRTSSARKLLELRFGESPPSRYSVDQLRGWEGSRMRRMFAQESSDFGIEWAGRSNDPNGGFEHVDSVNAALSAAFSKSYTYAHLVLLTLGLSPSLGVLHRGQRRSMVFDAADLFKPDLAREVFERAAESRPPITSAEVRAIMRPKIVSSIRDALWA